MLLLFAQASPPIPGNDAPSDKEIVVTAKTRDAVDRLVESMTHNERGKQIARWNASICPRAIGIDAAHAGYVEKRINAIALKVKLQIGRNRCHPNILIIFTAEPDGFARELVRRHPRLFGNPDEGLASRSRQDALLSSRPVRWLAASRTNGPQGVPIAERLNPIHSASRLIRSTREDAALSMIIVDAARLEDFTWGQVSAYLAMVSLARPDMNAYFDEETIMSLFNRSKKGTHPPIDLTRNDYDLLLALYSTAPGSSAEIQRSNMSSFMRHTGSSSPGIKHN
ncbi:hypothetical protein [Sphingomonas endolithica]|uniref:hypothetical protein n=1 Tax=Sphingomonas endolithica TaxID=2972485 RepID=UPI0021AEC4A7|nr:hypothetical protein [Sphingomonas sp. ZFBP2030]